MFYSTYKMSRDLASLLRNLPISADIHLQIKDENRQPNLAEIGFISKTLQTGLKPHIAKRALKALNRFFYAKQNKKPSDQIKVTFEVLNKGILRPSLIDRVLQRMACSSCTQAEASALVQKLENYFILANEFNYFIFFNPIDVWRVIGVCLITLLLSISLAVLPVFLPALIPALPITTLMLSLIAAAIIKFKENSSEIVVLPPDFLLPEELRSILNQVTALEKNIGEQLINYETKIVANVKNNAIAANNDDELPSYTEAIRNSSPLSLPFFKSATSDTACRDVQEQNIASGISYPTLS